MIRHTRINSTILLSATFLLLQSSDVRAEFSATQPFRLYWSTLLGSAPAPAIYKEKLETFLKNSGILYEVPMYAIHNPSSITSFLHHNIQPVTVSFGGIWLDPKQLNTLKEAEVVFELGYAATAYTKLSFKPEIVQGATAAAPYALLGIINKLVVDHAPDQGMLKYLTYAALAFVDYHGIKTIQEEFVHALSAQNEHKNQSALVVETVKMLCNNGYSWAADEYIQLLKDQLSRDKAAVSSKALTIRELIQLIETTKNSLSIATCSLESKNVSTRAAVA